MASCLSHLPSKDDSYTEIMKTPGPVSVTGGSHMGGAGQLALDSRLARRPDTHQGATRNRSANNTGQFVPLSNHRDGSRTRNFATPGVSREQQLQATKLGVTTGVNVNDFLKMYS